MNGKKIGNYFVQVFPCLAFLFLDIFAKLYCMTNLPGAIGIMCHPCHKTIKEQLFISAFASWFVLSAIFQSLLLLGYDNEGDK